MSKPDSAPEDGIVASSAWQSWSVTVRLGSFRSDGQRLATASYGETGTGGRHLSIGEVTSTFPTEFGAALSPDAVAVYDVLITDGLVVVLGLAGNGVERIELTEGDESVSQASPGSTGIFALLGPEDAVQLDLVAHSASGEVTRRPFPAPPPWRE
jgi:hypothetical protein